MAYTLGNKCAKNLCKWTVLLQLIMENVVTCFFGTQCSNIILFMLLEKLYTWRHYIFRLGPPLELIM